MLPPTCASFTAFIFAFFVFTGISLTFSIIFTTLDNILCIFLLFVAFSHFPDLFSSLSSLPSCFALSSRISYPWGFFSTTYFLIFLNYSPPFFRRFPSSRISRLPNDFLLIYSTFPSFHFSTFSFSLFLNFFLYLFLFFSLLLLPDLSLLSSNFPSSLRSSSLFITFSSFPRSYPLFLDFLIFSSNFLSSP